ncbi:MAG TPA: hypothetical protein VGI43_17060 [Mucilaginibacter sp.]|jgi:hypothetical protein
MTTPSKMIKLIRTLAVLLLLFFISIIVIQSTHPIILKWLTGTARIIGEPIKATVSTDGCINKDIKVYREKTFWDGKKTNDYILTLKEFDKIGMLKFINIKLTYKWVGRPVSTNNADYDTINGSLFQSEVGYHSIDFRDDTKGFNFDPGLKFTEKDIKFNIPPKLLKFNSIWIEFN